jgi:hypothetical protein
MEPTINNVLKAQREIERLKELQAELKSQAGADQTILDAEIQQATENMGELSRRTAETQIQTQLLNSTIMAVNSMPFIILTQAIQNLYKWIADSGNAINKTYKGLPEIITKVIALIVALTVMIGLAYSRQTALNGAATYFQAIWNSSVIVQGIKGFISLLGTVIALITAAIGGTHGWTLAQWNLNIAMSVNPIGVIVAAIALILTLVIAVGAAVYFAWQWWSKSAQAAEEHKKRIENMEKATENFRNKIGEAVDRYKELNNLARQYHEDNVTDVDLHQSKFLSKLLWHYWRILQ